VRVNGRSLAKVYKSGLHLLLAAAILFYLYSPLLDHWLGHESYARPHTHYHITADILAVTPDYHKLFSTHQPDTHDDHEEEVLCLLDINALSIALYTTISPNWFLDFAHNAPLTFELYAPYFLTASVYLSSLDPPPRI
jgi:hypothetical protein